MLERNVASWLSFCSIATLIPWFCRKAFACFEPSSTAHDANTSASQVEGAIMVANRMHKKLIFETLLDIETFQANKFNVPQKSGKISMENIFENNFSKVAGDNGSWVPSVGHTHGSSPAGLYPDASHGIDDFDAFGIKATKYTAGNEQKKSEYGNNNVKGK